jgi:hypothetical protein
MPPVLKRLLNLNKLIFKKCFQAGEVAQVTKGLPRKYEALGSIPSTAKKNFFYFKK